MTGAIAQGLISMVRAQQRNGVVTIGPKMYKRLMECVGWFDRWGVPAWDDGLGEIEVKVDFDCAYWPGDEPSRFEKYMESVS